MQTAQSYLATNPSSPLLQCIKAYLNHSGNQLNIVMGNEFQVQVQRK